MKTIFSLLFTVFFSVVVFAQDSKVDKKADSTMPTYVHECYMMKDGTLIHHVGEKFEPVTVDVKLKTGTMLTAKGNMLSNDGVKTQLQNGECISLMGGVGDCEKMH